MRRFARNAICIGVAAALLAGCSPLFDSAQGDTVPAAMAKNWVLPAAKSGDLLYVATGDNVYVLSYPQGKLVGSLGIGSSDLCSDKDGDVFVGSGYDVYEYAHGGTSPIQALEAGDIPLGCAVDPRTGNLAVTLEASGAGEVAIFPGAKAPSTWYRDPDIYMYGLCGYDDRGNLFVDGAGGDDGYIAKLPKGSSTFTNYSLDSSGFDVFGGIQWDGRHIAFSNPTTDQIFRLKFGKTAFEVVGTTQITGWQNGYSGRWPYTQTWLHGGTFIAQSSSQAELGLWPYPAGGNARKTLGPFKGGDVSIYGITISVAPR
jgi:hypothetical protein